MRGKPSRFALHAMYNSFLRKWGAEHAPDFKSVEADWSELTTGLSDEQVRTVTELIMEQMTGFPGTIHVKRYAAAVREGVTPDRSREELMAMEILHHVCATYPGKDDKYRVADALEIAASVLYVHQNAESEVDQENKEEHLIMPRKRMFLREVGKWVLDSYGNEGDWATTIREIQKVYG